MNSSPQVIFVSHFSPSATGHGGQHRTYQIYHDLTTALGADGVHCVTPVRLAAKADSLPPKLPVLRRAARRVQRILDKYVAERPPASCPESAAIDYRPARLLVPRLEEEARILETIDKLLRPAERRTVVVAEHPGLLPSIRALIADRAALWVAPQNLETINALPLTNVPVLSRHVRQADFDAEIDALSLADQRFVISTVEAGFHNTIGLPSLYYPYLPVGEIRDRCLQLRDARSPTAGNLLMLGSATHGSTHEGMLWLLDRWAESHGLPGKRLQVVGNGTDSLVTSRYGVLAGVDCLGWVSEERLTELLANCEVVLAPQFRGMGALTKLSELSLAGVPLITGAHARYAMNPPPGVLGLPQDWSAWHQALTSRVSLFAAAPLEEYESWERQQTNPMVEFLKSPHHTNGVRSS